MDIIEVVDTYGELQGGRDPVIAETSFQAQITLCLVVLQGGRDPVIAETHASDTAGRHCCCFNEAAIPGSRKRAGLNVPIVIDSPLQGGRDPVIAETGIYGGNASTGRGASMRPRSRDRGNKDAKASLRFVLRLQGGRDPVIAETSISTEHAGLRRNGFNEAAIPGSRKPYPTQSFTSSDPSFNEAAIPGSRKRPNSAKIFVGGIGFNEAAIPGSRKPSRMKTRPFYSWLLQGGRDPVIAETAPTIEDLAACFALQGGRDPVIAETLHYLLVHNYYFELQGGRDPVIAETTKLGPRL